MTHDIAVAVFGRNESRGIHACLTHLLAAQGSHRLSIDVLLNGTTDASADLARSALQPSMRCDARIWRILHADKSNAINQFLFRIRPVATTYVFVDAYARVSSGSLTALTTALDQHPSANAAAAIPVTGRSAAATRAALLKTPAIHGSLFALRRRFVDRLAQAGFRLPLNLYRGDGLIGSMVAHDLDAKNGRWDTSRVVVAAEASWAITPLSPFSVRDIRRQWERQIRQQRGRLESGAIKDLIYGAVGGYGALDANADAMVTSWLRRFPEQRPAFLRNPLAVLAAWRAASAIAPTENELVPVREWVHSAET